MRTAATCFITLTSLSLIGARALGVEIPSGPSDIDVAAVVNGNN